MPLEYTRRRKGQQRITMISFGIACGTMVLLYLFLRVTGLDEVVRKKVMEIAESIAPPPPPPPPPPDVKADVKAPPKIDMNFDVKTMLARPTLDAGFDLGSLTNFSADMEAPDLAMEAMEFSSNDMVNLVSNAQLPVMNLMTNIGFDIGAAASDEKKVTVSGTGKRTSGAMALAILDIPGNEATTNKWSKGELETIADYISRNTSLKVRLGARSIQLMSPFSSFDTWLAEAKKRVKSEYKELPASEPEINGLDVLSNAMPFVAENDPEQAKNRIKRMMSDYLRIKFDARVALDKGGWADSIKKVTPLKEYQVDFIKDAESSFNDFANKKVVTGKEVRGIYMMLRMFELAELPILFCEPRGVLDMPLPENIKLLRTYLTQANGFIYFCNTPELKNARAVIGLIRELTQEGLKDPVGEKTLAKLKVDDQEVSGYTFREPEPQMGHPWVFFPMILPRETNVSISIYNKFGTPIFNDTIKKIGPGAFLQKNRHYRWNCADVQGNQVESGYYVYQVRADLFVKTGPVGVSVLRKLTNGKHGIFSSYYPIAEVPTKEALKPDALSYGEPGVFGVMFRGRLAVLFTEGYKEKDPIGGEDQAAKEAALRWMTNVVIYALSERQLAR